MESYVAATRASAQTHLKAAQELSQSRHILSDELSELGNNLVSVLSDEGGQPTLLEDLETFHRNLKELQSVKTYVQVVEHALNLRYDFPLTRRWYVPNFTLSQREGDPRHSIRCSHNARVSSTVRCPLALCKQGSRDCVVSRRWEWAADITSRLVPRTPTRKDMARHQIDPFDVSIQRNAEIVLIGLYFLDSSLSSAAEQLGWPTAVNYPACDLAHRQAFEKHFLNLLSLQLL